MLARWCECLLDFWFLFVSIAQALIIKGVHEQHASSPGVGYLCRSANGGGYRLLAWPGVVILTTN